MWACKTSTCTKWNWRRFDEWTRSFNFDVSRALNFTFQFIINYFFRPSVHQAFDAESEVKERELFEEAEFRGRNGEDCELIYSECEKSPLDAFSNLIAD